MRHVDKIRLRRLKDRVSVDNSREMDKRVSLHVYIYLCRRTSRMNFVEKVFGTHSDRELKYIYPIIDKIEKLRPTMQAMSDEELKDQTRKFKERLAQGETLDDLLPEAFATVREAAKRVSISESFLMSAAPSCGILPHNRIRLHRTILNILTPSGFLFNDFM